MLLITHVNLNDTIDISMTSLAFLLVFFLRVTFSAQVAVLAWLENNAAGLIFAICASIALDVNLINAFSRERWCSWDPIFFILLSESTAPKRSNALAND